MSRLVFPVVFAALIICPLEAIEITGQIQWCHDPSTPIYENDRYWVFSTNNNLNLRWSYDLITWHWGTQPFSYAAGVPAYMRNYLQTCESGSSWNLWAPEIIRHGDLYYLYYSRNMCSDYDCTERSVCGLAIGSSILGRNWVDQGAVLWSGLCDDYRRNIDPTLLFDPVGNLWMAVGSFGHPSGNGWTHGGIWLYRMDKETGMVQSGTSPTQIARAWIEAPYLYYKDGYYYLFFNQETCCAGVDSRYFIRYGRATGITGPYYDKEGVNLLTQNNGSLFLGRDYDANYSSGSIPRPEFGSVGREIGPGHIGIFTAQDGLEMFSFHFYDANANGNATLGIRTLIWGDDGWPRAGWDMQDGHYAIVSCMNTDPGAPSGGLFAEAADLDSDRPQMWGWNGGHNQIWNFTRVARNQYRITCRVNELSLAVVSTGAGYEVRLVPYNSTNNAHRWSVVQTNNRAFRLINAATSLALEVQNAENAAGAALTVGPWDTAQRSHQMFWLSPTGIYAMTNSFGGCTASVADGNPATRLRITDWTGSLYQQWRFIPTFDGYTKIVNVGSGLPVELRNGAAGDYEQIRQNTDLNNNFQKWAIEPLTDGSSRVLHKTSGKAIETAGAAGGSLTRQRRWLHTLAQQWTFQSQRLSPSRRIWTGSGTTQYWSDTANWELPAFGGELLIFNDTVRLSSTNDLVSDRPISSIRFLTGAGGFTLNGNRIGLFGDIINRSAYRQTINTPLHLLGSVSLFDARSGDIRVNGAISGSGNLVKEGPGTLFLSAENSYHGTTAVRAGTLKMEADDALPADTALMIAAGATLDLNGFNLTVESLDNQGAIINSGCRGSVLTVLQPSYVIALPGNGMDGLRAISAYWLDMSCSGTDWCMGADRDRNGVVDIRDFEDLAARWQGAGCNDE